jgi:hypothetical protein
MKMDATATKYTSWWCSNGLYKKVTSAGNKINNANQVIGYGTNKRMELAMVGCPQKRTLCGTVTLSSITTALDTSTDAAGVVLNVGAVTLDDKCTYVATSTVVPPAFTMSGGATSPKGLMTTNWQIHAMEYTATAPGVPWAASEGSL